MSEEGVMNECAARPGCDLWRLRARVVCLVIAIIVSFCWYF